MQLNRDYLLFLISNFHQTLGRKPADDTSQIEPPKDLGIQSKNLSIPCQESNGNAKKAKSNDVIKSVDMDGSMPKVNDVKFIKKKRSTLQKKRGNETYSFGCYMDTQLRKITNPKYRDKTERDVLRLLLDRIENEPVKFENFHLFSRFIKILKSI